MSHTNHPDTALIRSKLIAGLIAAGAPAADAATITDTAMRAASAAMLTINRICTELPGSDAGSALCIAFQLAEELAKYNASLVEAQLRETGGDLQQVNITVDARH